MKKILLALLLVPSVAFAGPEVTENDLITDPKVGTYILGRMNEDGSTISATEGDAIAPSLNRKGQLMCSLDAGTSAAGNPIKLEDSAHASGDAGLAAWAVRNEGQSVYPGSNDDYSPIATNRYGTLQTQISTAASVGTLGVGSNGYFFYRSEDEASANGDAGAVALFIRRDTLVSGAGAADGDYIQPSASNRGALHVAATGDPYNGTLTARGISAATNNSTSIYGSSGTIYNINVCNNNAAARYFKIYNKATAPTCGTDTPALTLMVPASNCNVSALSVPWRFSTGIGICIVTGIADSDNTATGANEVTYNVGYIAG